MCVDAASSESYRGTSLENIRGFTDVHTQNVLHTDYSTPAVQSDGVQMHYQLPEQDRNMPNYSLQARRQANVEMFIEPEHGHTLIEKIPMVSHVPEPTKPTGIIHNNSVDYRLPEALPIESFKGEQRRPNLHRVDPHGARRNTKSTSVRRAVNSGIAGRVW